MKWEEYKRLSPAQKQEYDFEMRKLDWAQTFSFIGALGFLIISFISEGIIMRVSMGVAGSFIILFAYQLLAEHIFIQLIRREARK